jgi:opacity protein-like surface antigen
VKVFALAALAACALALPASAQGLDGLWNPHTYLDGSYVEATGGSTFQGATTEFNSGTGNANKGSGHFDAGGFGSLTFGKRVAPGLSVELEGLYFNNRYDRATIETQGTAGNMRTYGGVANLRFSLPYDYRVTQRIALVPYVGVGAGYGQVHYNTTAPFDDSQSGLLWQAKTGVEIKTGTPISFDLGYRYIGTPEDSHDFVGADGDSSFRLRSHAQAATAGVKYTF